MRLLLMAVAVVLTGCGDIVAGPPRQPPPKASTAPVRAVELSGGTLAIASGGRFAAVSDPEHDRLWIVDLSSGALHGKVQLPEGSQPQRIVEDGAGKLRVALRGLGQVATVSPSQLSVLDVADACPEVRGLTWNKEMQALQVACAGGELVTLKGSIRSVLKPAADLRDVVQAKGKTWVSTFRAAQLMQVSATGTVDATVTLPSVALPSADGKPAAFVPAVAWRTVVTPGGQVVTVHQREVEGDIGAIQVPNAPPAPAYYANVCNSGIVRSTVSLTDEGKVTGSFDIAGVLPIDVAVSPDGTELAVAQPGSGFVQRIQLGANTVGISGGGLCAPSSRDVSQLGEVTGVAYTPQSDLIVHTRTPMAIWVLGRNDGAPTQQQILLTGDSVNSKGHTLFHQAAGASQAISCASCHPEGGDDGHVWRLLHKDVRTQSLAGGVVETAPFHWNGQLASVQDVVTETFVGRMGGSAPTAEVVAALSDWMGGIPQRKVVASAPQASLELGLHLFTDAKVGCSSCHSGERFTNNLTVDVGTGGEFQVPSLRGVSLRGPWMHDGCAKTLKDRFSECGGKAHGDVSHLANEELDALVAYLQTL